jgi:NADPH:quinone reductase-like Zn-dependent oxidoreductase
MKAVVQDVYGPHDVLEVREVEEPTVGDDDLLVRVQAAGVDPSVWHIMTGLPYAIRLAGYGLRAPKVRIRGTDVAGRVEAVGANVTRFKPGDEVLGTCNGSFAEYVSARHDRFVKKPANLTFEQAATVPISGCTALQALRDKGRIQPGQNVLVIGAGGGVGTYAVQLAKTFEAHVTGVCSTAKVEFVRSIGADEVIDYTRDDFADGKHRYDLILDLAGNRSLSHLRRALAPRGTLVIVGGEGAGGRLLAGADRSLRASVLTLFVGQKLTGLLATTRRDDVQLLADLIDDGKITPVVDRTFPLSEVPEALRYVQEGHARGKVVIAI